jgi:hypothetical protein
MCAALAAPVLAEAPHAAYVFPAGGQRGANVDVRIGGCYLHEAAALHLEGEGISLGPTSSPSNERSTTGIIRRAEETVWFEGPLLYPPESSRKEDYPKDYLGTLEIAADAPLGLHYCRVSTSQGVTAAMKFVVGDLPEVVEREIDGEPIPVAVTLPVTINGRIFPRRDEDVWTFDAPAGREITCSVAAASLGSPLSARLEIRDPAGKLFAESSGQLGIDPVLRFTTTAAGTYEVRIHDAAYEGMQDHVYRLTISDGPWIDGFFPLGGRRGGELAVELRGQQLSQTKLSVPIPADAPELFAYATQHDGRATLLGLEVGDRPEAIESEPNDAPAVADASGSSRAHSAPVTLNGRIDKPGDVDVWTIEMTKGQKLELAVHAARLGSPLDSLLVVRDAAGNELATNDDASAGQPDSALVLTAKEDGPVQVAISDRFAQRGGPAFAYRLHVAPPGEADFSLTLPADALVIDRGGQQKLQLAIAAAAGFSRPIKITAEGLPEGVTAAPLELKRIAGNKQTLNLAAAGTCPLGIHRVRIVGTTTDAGEPITRVAEFTAGPGEPPRQELVLAVAEPTPFTFAAEYAFSFVARGSVHYKHYRIERNGYEGPLEVALADRQIRHLQGVAGPKIVVPAGASEFDYPVYLPPWMELGRTSRSTLMATGVVMGADGRQHKVCYTSGGQNDQIICRVSPAQLQISATRAVRLAPDAAVEIPVSVKRGAAGHGPVRIELVLAPHVSGITTEPVLVPEGAEQATLTLRVSSSAGPFTQPLLLRATCGEGDQRVVGETEVEVIDAP